LLARLLFQLDPSTPAGPSRVACLFMIAKRSNVLSCREPETTGGGRKPATITSGAWPCAVVLLQQPVQNSRVSARHVEYLRPARLPRHKRDRLAADTERRSDRSQRCRCRLAIDGTGVDPDDQRAVVLAAHARMGGTGPDPDGDSHEPQCARAADGQVRSVQKARADRICRRGRAGQAGSCRHGRAVRMQRRRALRPPRPSNQSCSPATSREGITLSDGTTKKERTPTRRYLKPGFGCLRCNRRGCFAFFCCLADTLSEQCLRRRPHANPLVADVFRTKRLLRERCAATCLRRRRPGQARRRRGRLQITAVRRGCLAHNGVVRDRCRSGRSARPATEGEGEQTGR
jgi:hypothetical protein